MSDPDDFQSIVTIWERSIDTQKHFNDLSLRTRQLGITIVGAILGLGIALKGDVGALELGGCNVPMLTFIFLAASLMMIFTRFIDVGIYHPMLRGAVAFNEDIERQCMLKRIHLQHGLTETISIYSRYSDAKRVIEGESYTHTGTRKHTLGRRLDVFYFGSASALFILAVLSFLGRPALS